MSVTHNRKAITIPTLFGYPRVTGTDILTGPTNHHGMTGRRGMTNRPDMVGIMHHHGTIFASAKPLPSNAMRRLCVEGIAGTVEPFSPLQ